MNRTPVLNFRLCRYVIRQHAVCQYVVLLHVSQFIVTCNYVKGLKNIIFQDVKTKANVIVKKSTLRRITAETLATFTCSPFFIFSKTFLFRNSQKTFFTSSMQRWLPEFKKKRSNPKHFRPKFTETITFKLFNDSSQIYSSLFFLKKTAKTETRIV